MDWTNATALRKKPKRGCSSNGMPEIEESDDVGEGAIEEAKGILPI